MSSSAYLISRPSIIGYLLCLCCWLLPVGTAYSANTEDAGLTLAAAPKKAPSKLVAPKHLEQDDMTELPTGRYIASGLVGTLAGFGIGHAVQGTWRRVGWFFTVGDSVSLLASIVILFSERDTTTNADGTQNVGFKQTNDYWIAMGSFYLIHLWEVVDIWTRPKMFEGKRYVDTQQAGTRLVITPLRNGATPGLGLALQTSF